MARRSAGIGIAVAVGLVVALMPTPSAGAVAGTPLRDDASTLAVGDSVMLGAQPCLERRGFAVDAKGSRNVTAVPFTLDGYDRLPDIVVVHAGTNGGAERWQFDAVMEQIGRKRQVVFVTVQLPDGTSRYTFEASTNKAIRALPRRYPNAHVADWQALSDEHPRWLGGDGIHLTPDGCTGYARMVADAERRVVILTNPYVPMGPLPRQ
jgi:hypothetical protein